MHLPPGKCAWHFLCIVLCRTTVGISEIIRRNINTIQRYRIRWMLIIALCWTAIEVGSKIAFTKAGRTPGRIVRLLSADSIALRTVIVFCVSLLVSYMLVFRFRGMFRKRSLLNNFLTKTVMLIGFAVFGNFLIHISYTMVVMHYNPWEGLKAFWQDSTTTTYLVERTISWMMTYSLTLLVIEINEKYSPGLFFSIIFGSYVNPRVEHRIIMFLDLKDSTPLAEKLGTTTYFLFIRDFIYYVSSALLEYGGSIYQYVGDEVITTWLTSPASARKCLNALADARKQIEKQRGYFLKKYGVIPEFRAGIHEGEVTVGEIGIVKKDLAMSGDTMNTAARIRTACAEVNRDVLASNEFIRLLTPNEKTLSITMGVLDLKGKSAGLELFTFAA